MTTTKRLLMAGGLALLVAAALTLFGAALGAQGEVDVVVNWPGTKAGTVEIHKTDGSGKIWVILDRSEKSVTLVNFPTNWTFRISPTREERPSISVGYGPGLHGVLLIRGYSGDEVVTESTLDSSGEAAELMLPRCSIEFASI